MIGGTIVGVVYVPGAVQEPMNILKAKVLTRGNKCSFINATPNSIFV